MRTGSRVCRSWKQINPESSKPRSRTSRTEDRGSSCGATSIKSKGLPAEGPGMRNEDYHIKSSSTGKQESRRQDDGQTSEAGANASKHPEVTEAGSGAHPVLSAGLPTKERQQHKKCQTDQALLCHNDQNWSWRYPVSKNEKWGLLRSTKQLLREMTMDEVGLSHNGRISAAETEHGRWTVVTTRPITQVNGSGASKWRRPERNDRSDGEVTEALTECERLLVWGSSQTNKIAGTEIEDSWSGTFTKSDESSSVHPEFRGRELQEQEKKKSQKQDWRKSQHVSWDDELIEWRSFRRRRSGNEKSCGRRQRTLWSKELRGSWQRDTWSIRVGELATMPHLPNIDTTITSGSNSEWSWCGSSYTKRMQQGWQQVEIEATDRRKAARAALCTFDRCSEVPRNGESSLGGKSIEAGQGEADEATAAWVNEKFWDFPIMPKMQKWLSIHKLKAANG